MLMVLFFAGIIAAIAFPNYLIKAIRTTDEENDANGILASISFAIVVVSILVLGIY